MARQFQYHGSPDQIRKYLTELGYETEDIYNREKDLLIAFAVRGTSIVVGYGQFVPHGEVAMWSSPMDDPEKRERSLALYRRLYRRFRKPSSKLTDST